ncbi:MAG: zinc ribbon domain-containing protein, partial [Ruminococcus sp.]|nr:zinc ribbon domain-containing protein [Ruminococcus sp.]
MKCPYCGAEVYEGARHCFACMTGLCSRKVIDIDVKAERRRRLAYIPGLVTGALACSVAAYGIANRGEGREIPTSSGELGNSSYSEEADTTAPDSLSETATTTTTKSTKPTTTMMTSYTTTKASTTKKKTTTTTPTQTTPTKKTTTTQPVTQTAAPQQEEYYQEPQEEYQEETPPETVIIYETLPPETVIVYQEPEEPEPEPEPDLYPDGATVYSKNAANYIHNKYGVDVGYSGKFDVAVSKKIDEFIATIPTRTTYTYDSAYTYFMQTSYVQLEDPSEYFSEVGLYGVITHFFHVYDYAVYIDSTNNDLESKIQSHIEKNFILSEVPGYEKPYISVVAKRCSDMYEPGKKYYVFSV